MFELQPWTAEHDALLAALPRDERTRIMRYRRTEDRCRALMAAILPRLAIGYRRDLPLGTIILPRTAAGKPFYADDPGLCFNLSHSGNYVALALGPAPVGVDIELIRAKRDSDAIAKRFFATDEFRWLSRFGQPERAVRFYELWSRKESVVKAAGDGLAGNLAGFSTVPGGDCESAVNVDGHRWWVRSFHEPTGYSLAVCTAAAGLPLRKPILSRDGTKPSAPRLADRACQAVAELLDQAAPIERPS